MKEKIPAEGLFVILAAAGGIARYLNGYASGEKFHVSIFLANLIVSAFSGLMFALFVGEMGLSQNYQWIASGIGGFMGTETVKLIAQKFKKQL